MKLEVDFQSCRQREAVHTPAASRSRCAKRVWWHGRVVHGHVASRHAARDMGRRLAGVSCVLTNGTLHCPANCGERCRGIEERSRVPDMSAALRALEHEAPGSAHVTWTLTDPAFIIAIDVNKRGARSRSEVSHSVQVSGVHESRYTAYWTMLTAKCCAGGGSVLDVGANLGYYSLLAASLGCRVVAWEPVSRFRAYFVASLALNNLSHRVTVRDRVASDTTRSSVTMRVPPQRWDISSVDGLNLIPAQRGPNSSAARYVAPAETLDSVVREQACAMKLDTEGFEPVVVRGAEALLRDRPPHIILLEYTPGAVERSAVGGAADALERPPVRYSDFPAMLGRFQESGYRTWQLASDIKYKELLMGSIPEEKEVLPASIAAEKVNAANVRKRFTDGGFAFPFDLHPHSLRASFEYNTDLLLLHRATNWSALGLAAMPIRTSRPVGVTADSYYGLGALIPCWKLRPPERLGRLCGTDSRNRDESRAERTSAIAHAAILAERGESRHISLAEALQENASVMRLSSRKTNQVCWWERQGCFLRASQGRQPRRRGKGRRGRETGGGRISW